MVGLDREPSAAGARPLDVARNPGGAQADAVTMSRPPPGSLVALAASLALAAAACGATAPLAPRAIELNRAGAEALARGELELAEARIALALEYHPRFVEALTNLGLVEMQRGNLARARVLLERARRTNADLAQPHHALGVLAERERRPDVAAGCYREALRVEPGFAASRANLARLLFAAGRFDDAREQFQRLVEADATSLEGRAGLVESLLRLGRTDEADRETERALDDLGAEPRLVVLAARRELRAGRPDAADELLAAVRDGRSDDARAAWSFTAVARLERAHPGRIG